MFQRRMRDTGATMIRVKVKLCLCFIVLMLLQSCAPRWICTYNGEKFKTEAIYRPFVGICEYKGGYWGKWFSDDRLRYIVDESVTGFTITYYNKYRHPSDFEFKIIAKKYTWTDELGAVYQGEFIVKKAREINISKYYKKPQSGISALKETWSFPCTIKRLESTLPEDKYIYPQLPSPLKYTLNVFYNGVGRGFGINGEWVQAGGYDTW